MPKRQYKNNKPNPKMTTEQLQKKLNDGGIFLVGEYRVGKPDLITYRDKLSGKSASFKQVVHSVEAGQMVVAIQERLDDSVSLETGVNLPAKKGEKVVVELESLERIQGFFRARGAIIPLTAK